MTMHLAHPALSTTGKKRGKKKWASAEAKRKAEQLQDSWQQLVAKHTPKTKPKQQVEAWKPTSGVFRRETPHINSLPFTGGVCTKAPDKVYTGTMIKGIGTMHKSNAVPIFSDEQAIEISKMRR
jgi:hypothetical protein